ncbi:hypothetical protein SK53_00504 [Enterobacter sp. MGH119]|nr:hypothetical protein SK53_00504 [Enterobacter sp. MGH119]
MHRTGKRDRLAGINIIPCSTGNATLLLIAILDARHLNDPSCLDNPVLYNLGVNIGWILIINIIRLDNLNLHAHHFLVCRHQLVTHLQPHLQ